MKPILYANGPKPMLPNAQRLTQQCRLACASVFSVLVLAAVIGCRNKDAAAPTDGPPTDASGFEAEPAPTTPPEVKPKPLASRDEIVQRIVRHMDEGRLEEAKVLLRELLVRDPEDFESVFRLANAEATEGNLSGAIELLAGIPANHPEAGLPSLGVSADLCFQIKRYEDAETRYLKVLELDPSIVFAKRQLAYLYNRQGRRHEAVTLIRELCLSGDITQDELHALIVESDAMYDPVGSQPAPGTRPYWPIGESGLARHLFTEKRFLAAAELLRPIVESGDATPSTIALFGRAAVEAQDVDMFNVWRSHVDEESKKYPEHWAAVGTHLIREVQFKPAVRALAEAVRLDPTDLKSMRRIFQGLRSMDQADEAEVWVDHFAFMNKILTESNQIASSANPPIDTYQQIAGNLEKAGRRIEAVLWRSVAAANSPYDSETINQLRQKLRSIVSSETAFPNRGER